MVNSTNQRKQMWADKEFVKTLEKIKAKRLLEGNPVPNMHQLTKEIMECPSFKKVLQEVINYENFELKIKFDKKKIW